MQSGSLIPAIQPFAHDGSPVGVVLCHGFTGSPASMRPWAEHLADAGYTVDLPRLPGHGSTWQGLNLTRWPDWFARVERSLLQMAQRCETIVVAGLSMGGCLALRLAQVHGDLVHGLILVNPNVTSADPRVRILPILRYLTPSAAGLSNDIAMPGQDELAYDRTPLHALYSLSRLWRVVQRDMSSVIQPVLLFRSAHDHVVDPSGAALIRSGVSSSDVTEVVLHRSYHVATLDYDAETIVTVSDEFLKRVTADGVTADVERSAAARTTDDETMTAQQPKGGDRHR